jgi:hypothetical protein
MRYFVCLKGNYVNLSKINEKLTVIYSFMSL